MSVLEKGKYIIFLDIDGTVFDGKQVPEKNVQALRRAKAEGHKIFLNTGRADCIVTKEIRDAIQPDGVVSSMGTAIFVGKECIYSAVMPREDVEYLVRFGEELGVWVIIESIEKLVSLNGPAYLDQDHFLDHAENLFVQYSDMQIGKVSYMQGLPEESIAPLRKRFKGVYPHSKYVEIPTGDCNKATAIQRVCDYYGVGIECSIAMGDSGNDVDMVRFAGIGVAMGNATEEIKEAADFITLSCEDSGVAYAIEKLIFDKENDGNGIIFNSLENEI